MARNTPAFPSWAPADVIARWQEEARVAKAGGHPRTRGASGNPQEYRERALGIPGLLFRLLTDERMREVWEAVTRGKLMYRLDDYADAQVSRPAMFTVFVIDAFMGPWREEQWSPAKRSTWQREVAGLADRLANKLEGTRANDFRSWPMSMDSMPAPGVAPAMSGLLNFLSRHAGAFLPPQVLSRPRGGEARRAYFLRTLAALHPAMSRRLLATVGAVALQDDKLDARQVRRLLADGKSRKRRK